MTNSIVLLRSGRHLQTAVLALRNSRPGCRLLVVAQPGTEPVLEQLGIPEADRFIFDRHRFFSPFALAVSSAGRRLRRRSFGEVAVLWSDPDGKGHANVNRTALYLSPSGFLAVTPDGSVLRQQTWKIIRQETRRTMWSVLALVVINVTLCAPALLLRLFRR